MAMLVTELPKSFKPKRAYYESTRFPVVYRNKPLMPVRAGRANKLIKENKARFKFNGKLGIRYLELLVKPSDTKTQEIVLGVDLGSQFDGFSVVSKYKHHENLELIHPDKYNNSYLGVKSGYKPGSISFNLQRKKEITRERRGRGWNRPVRYDHRNKPKFPPTHRAMLNFRIWLIEELSKVYPVTKVIVEYVAYHYPKRSDFKTEEEFLEAVKFGRAHFTCVMSGQRQFTRHLKNLGFEVKTRKGYVTARLRRENFKYLEYDPKTSSKELESFYAHCIDSLTLAMLDFSLEERLALTDPKNLNTKVRALEKIRFIEGGNNPGGKRKLTMLKTQHGNKKEFIIYRSKDYISKNSNEVKEIKINGLTRTVEVIKPLGKESICRVQVEAKNFKDFNLINNGRVLRTKKYLRNNSTVTVPLLNSNLPSKKPKGPDTGLTQKLWRKNRPKESTGVSRYARYNGLSGDKRTNSFGRCREVCNSIRNNEDKYRLIEYRHQNLKIWKTPPLLPQCTIETLIVSTC